jgi:hypothetical protein
MTGQPPAGANPTLDRLTLDLERHVASGGWDQPTHLFALVETVELVRREPALAADLGLAAEPGSLTPVDQGDLPEHGSLDELLGGIGWPTEVLGAAVTVERLMLPPDVERDIPAAEGEALRWLGEHPDRQEVRLVVAVLRDGSRASAVRMRAHDDDTSVLTGRDLVPGLADALAATFAD